MERVGDEPAGDRPLGIVGTLASAGGATPLPPTGGTTGIRVEQAAVVRAMDAFRAEFAIDRAYDPHRDVSPLAASGYRYAPAIAWYGLPLGCRVPTPQSETPATPMDCAPDSYRQVPADSGAWQSDVFELDFRAAHRRLDPSTGTISLGGAGFVPHYLRSEPRSAAQTKRAGAHSPSALWVVRLQRDPAGRTNPDAPFSVEVWESRGAGIWVRVGE